MALRGVLTHRKTRRLARLLGISPCFALGILEALWHTTAEQCQIGDIGSMSDQDIADELFYDGDPAALITALVDSGWLDRSETHRLVVHDWSTHADSYVHAFLAKRTMLFADGAWPNVPHDAFNAGTRTRIHAEYTDKYGTNPPESRTSPGQVPSIPVPVPEPVPEPEPVEEPEINPPVSPPGTVLDLLGVEYQTPEILGAYKAFRSTQRGGWKEATLQAKAKEWGQFAPSEVLAALQESVRQGWKGVFPKKAKQEATNGKGKGPPVRTAEELEALTR